jgi:4-amino-4-deoxy-L-arabinose transferase-like glycosyltransferase
MKSTLRKIFFIAERLSPGAALALIALVSILARMAYLTILGGGFTSLPPEPDGLYYLDAARTLSTTGVYGLNADTPLLGPPPGQAAFLAVLLRVFGETVALLKMAHILVSTLTAILAYLIGRALFNRSVGLWTGLLVAIDPAQIYLSGSFLSETLFTCLMLTGLLFLVLERKKPSLWQAALAGLFFGLTGLTRNQGWPFPFLVLAGSLVSRGKLLNWKSASLAVIVTILTILPWTVRNHAVSGEWVMISTNGGLTLWSANNPEFVWRQPMPMSNPIYEAPEGLSATQIDAFYQSKAVEWIRQNPGRFLANGVRKLILLYHFDPLPQREGNTLLFRLAGMFPYALLLPFIFLGVWCEIKNPDAWLPLLMILFFTMLAFVFFGDSRARAPIQPLLYLFAMNWFSKWLSRTALTRKTA